MNKTKKNLWKYSLYTFFVSLSFSRAIFMLFLKDLGFTTAQMGLLESILFVATFVMEIPTGILGDRIGRGLCCSIAPRPGRSFGHGPGCTQPGQHAGDPWRATGSQAVL